MNFKLKLIVTSDNHNESIHDILSFGKDFKNIEQIGMSFSESKTITGITCWISN